MFNSHSDFFALFFSLLGLKSNKTFAKVGSRVGVPSKNCHNFAFLGLLKTCNVGGGLTTKIGHSTFALN
jgi:hypothetical protein